MTPSGQSSMLSVMDLNADRPGSLLERAAEPSTLAAARDGVP